MDQDYYTWWLLFQVRQLMFKVRQKELSKYGISHVEAAVLHIIQAIGNTVTPAEISRWVLREPHTISELLSRMEKKGLVRKVKDLDRRNLVRVMLTDKGHEAYYQSAERESTQNIMSALSEEERQQLGSCLWKLRAKALKELGIGNKVPFPPDNELWHLITAMSVEAVLNESGSPKPAHPG